MADKDSSQQTQSNLELYSKATLYTILCLFAVEMLILIPLVRFADITPLTTVIDEWFGSSLTVRESACVRCYFVCVCSF